MTNEHKGSGQIKNNFFDVRLMQRLFEKQCRCASRIRFAPISLLRAIFRVDC
jgi:hypothetical protein